MHGNSPASTPVHGNRLYDSKEAREFLGGISERKFRDLTSATGPLKAIRQGSRVYVTQAALDAYVASLQPAADDAA